MMVWEKWSCGVDSYVYPYLVPYFFVNVNLLLIFYVTRRTQVRLLLNGAPFSLEPICKADKKTGACELDALVNATAAVRTTTWGDATWNSTCGNPGF